MTINEARIFLNADAFDDLEDAYEQLLFDQKQYFLLKPCIPKVFESKIEKLNRYQKAAEVLGLETENTEGINQQIQLAEISILDFYRSYIDQLNGIRKMISQATCFSKLKELAAYRLNLFREYASKWPLFEAFKEGQLLSSEPEPVAFFQDLKQLESDGISTFASLVESGETVGILVKKESTRLYSLHKLK